MIVYRLSKSKFSNDLSGRGAEKAGGRWNSKGVALLYTSQSRALCTTEIAVHVPLGCLPEDYEMVTIEVPDFAEITEVNPDDLSEKWKLFPHPQFTQKIGDRFAREEKVLILKVPSAIIKGDYNFLINPGHKDFEFVRILDIEPFEFDKRLFNR